MTMHAIFTDEKAAKQFVAQIDADYGFPNADAQTYAIPTANVDGTWTVRIKDWLRLPVASAKWTKAPAAAKVDLLAKAGKLVEAAPEPKDKPVEVAGEKVVSEK